MTQEDPLEKEMTTDSSILAWEIPCTEDPRGLQSMGSQGVGQDLAAKQQEDLELAMFYLPCFMIDS